MRSGFGAVAKAKKDFEQQQAGWEGMRTRDMRLVKDGDEAVMWFIGCEPDEPADALVHTVNGKKFGYELCAHGKEGHEGCVYCWAAKNKDKRVKKPSKNFYFSVVDTRWVHKQKNEAKSQGGRDVFDWQDCPKTDSEPNAPCKACKRKIPRERAGVKKLRVGLTVAIIITNLNDSLKKKCLNCGGKMAITGYRKGKRVRPDLEDVENPEDWATEYECSKCDDPSPGSIFAMPITMRRNGSGQATTYAFEKNDEGFEDPPEWVQKFEPIDWTKALIPRSADNMAEQLEIDNPFDKAASGGKKGKKKESEDYDDEDEDDEDDEDEKEPFDEDEDEAPKKKKVAKKAAASSKGKRRVVDDDEDEDDDEAEDEDEEDEDD